MSIRTFLENALEKRAKKWSHLSIALVLMGMSIFLVLNANDNYKNLAELERKGTAMSMHPMGQTLYSIGGKEAILAFEVSLALVFAVFAVLLLREGAKHGILTDSHD